MKWADIQKRQNEKELLECQFAARYYFNCGEKLNYCVWGSCALAALMVFLPDSFKFAKFGILVIFELTALVLEYFMESSVKKAAGLRAYFDAYVLDLDYSRYSAHDKRKIKEIIVKVVDRKSGECQIQISHTGKDKPPGVLNWYGSSEDTLDGDLRYECQKQNFWWNKQLFEKRIWVTVISGLIIIAICVFLISIEKDTMAERIYMFICSGGLIAKSLERIYWNFKYHKLSDKIEAVVELPAVSTNAEQIQKLQEMLDKRRAMPVFEMNKLHEHFAKKLSDIYFQIRD